MLGLTKEEWRGITRMSGLLVLLLAGLTVLFDLVGMSGIVVQPAGYALILGIIVSGIMYTIKREPILYISVLMSTLAVGLGASIGILVISLY